MQEIEAIREFKDRSRKANYESALSLLTLAIGQIEKLDGLDVAQKDRIRRAVIRLSNAERRFAREAGR